MHMTVTRAKLETLVGDLLDRTREPCTKCMKDAGVAAKDIHEVRQTQKQSQSP